MRSWLIDGEVVCCDERGLATFQLLRHRRNEPRAFLYAFDLLELNGTDLRREPIEVRKATLASILRKSRPGVRLNEHMEHSEGAVVFQHACNRARGDGLEVAGIALPIWAVSRLAQVQKSGGTGGEAGSGRRLGQAIRSAGRDCKCVVSKREVTDNEITVGMGARNAPAGRETR
jgi:ATP dependent DNA ligase domain